MTLKQIGIASLIAGCLILVVAMTFINNTPPSKVALHPDLKPMLMLHNEHAHIAQNVVHKFNHQHSFLLMRHQLGYKYIRSINELLEYADHETDLIDQSNPIYSVLYIGSFEPKVNRFNYQPLHNTSIRAIKLIKDHQSNKVIALEAISATQHQYTPNYHLIITAEWFNAPVWDHLAQFPS